LIECQDKWKRVVFQHAKQMLSRALIAKMPAEGSLPFSAAGAQAAEAARPSAPPALLHPNFVLRVAAEPAGVADALSTGAAAAALVRINAADAALRGRIDAVCEQLFAICKHVTSDKLRTDIIQLKRDLFNRRPLPRARAADTVGALDADLAARVDAVLLECEAMRAARNELGQIYDEEIRLGRQALLQRLDADHIGIAVQQANRQLYSDVMRLRTHGPQGFKPKDLDQLFLTLQNYVLRAALKTSPKSTLTMFGVGEWVSDAAGGPLLFDFDALTARRAPQLNDIVVTKLLTVLLRNRRAWADHAVFARNPSFQASADTISWRNLLMETDFSGVSIGTQECRVALRRTRPVDMLLQAIERLGPDAFALGDLAGGLGAQAPERFQPVIDQLITDAVAKGLIGPRMQLGSQAGRLNCAKQILPDLEPDTAGRLVGAIAAVEADLIAYGEAPARDQATALGNLQASFASFEAVIGSDAQAGAADPLIQEDSRIDGPALSLDIRNLREIENDLRLLIRAAPLYTGGWGGVRYWMADRFIARFGRSGVCTDVAEFLTPLFDDIMTTVSEPRSGARPADPQPLFNHGLAEELRVQSQRFLAAVSAQRDDTGHLDIDRQWLARQIDALPDAVRDERRSHCINGQFLPDTPGQSFVVNAIYPGNGRMISRFLHNEERAVAKLQSYLSDISLAGRHLAVPGTFGMNANFHPPHAKEELQLQPFPADYERAKAVTLDSLNLRYDETRHNIYLCDDARAPIDCFYFGILFSYRLPKMQFLIDALSGFSEAPPPIGRVLAGRQQSREQMTFAPRVTIGSLVAARASWSAPTEQLPRADVAPAEFFYRLLDWHTQNGLPREVYFSSTQIRSDDGGTAMFKWRKPMFLDFENPMTVRTLQRLLRKSRAAVFFTEALPGRGDTIVRSGDARHVSEISFELSFVNRAAHHAALH
jgi:hypothetical protein